MSVHQRWALGSDARAIRLWLSVLAHSKSRMLCPVSKLCNIDFHVHLHRCPLRATAEWIVTFTVAGSSRSVRRSDDKSTSFGCLPVVVAMCVWCDALAFLEECEVSVECVSLERGCVRTQIFIEAVLYWRVRD